MLMKARHWFPVGRLAVAFIISAVASAVFGQASTSNNIPTVTVRATQSIASSPGNPGVFTVFRAGNTDSTLNVYFQIAGTASNGVDYATIPNEVLIPAGATSNSVFITPITGSALTTAKTVILQLAPPPFMIAMNYRIGAPSNAIVYIEAGTATNLPPTVAIISPKNGGIFYTPTNILLVARASDPDGTVTNVEFFAGAYDLGSGAPVILDPPGINGLTGLVYIYNWLNPPPGNYPLTAVATDNGGASTTSGAINIQVLSGPPTNQPPVIRIVSPASGSVYRAPINIPLFAFAADPDGWVASVQFFDGTNSLGFGHPIPTPVAAGALIPGPVPPIYPTNLYGLVWSNAPVGPHFLIAAATDNGGLVATSAPVSIAVLPPSPPPTNRPPIVSVVASDPVAIEGTNCWVWSGETNVPPTWTNWPAAVCRFFTNCGPKTATFTVRRCGDTNNDLTVTYAIGGSASNGVDYVALPGFITVPAGDRHALIPIIPIDDGPPDVNKTVILTLTPSTNTPPDYVIGFPPRAGVVILDGGNPWPATSVLPGGCFHLAVPGPDAAWYAIEVSTDFANWTPVCTNQVINGSIDYVDPEAPGQPARFYRAVPVLNPPAD